MSCCISRLKPAVFDVDLLNDQNNPTGFSDAIMDNKFINICLTQYVFLSHSLLDMSYISNIELSGKHFQFGAFKGE